MVAVIANPERTTVRRPSPISHQRPLFSQRSHHHALHHPRQLPARPPFNRDHPAFQRAMIAFWKHKTKNAGTQTIITVPIAVTIKQPQLRSRSRRRTSSLHRFNRTDPNLRQVASVSRNGEIRPCNAKLRRHQPRRSTLRTRGLPHLNPSSNLKSRNLRRRQTQPASGHSRNNLCAWKPSDRSRLETWSTSRNVLRAGRRNRFAPCLCQRPQLLPRRASRLNPRYRHQSLPHRAHKQSNRARPLRLRRHEPNLAANPAPNPGNQIRAIPIRTMAVGIAEYPSPMTPKFAASTRRQLFASF